MTRFVDRGAVTAAYVGIGMAVTVTISFLLVIPIEPIVVLLAFPSGLVIGYYANQRSDRRHGPWSRILRNGLFAALVTGVVAGMLLLGVKSIFFFADNGYPDFNRIDPKTGAVIPPVCDPGAACVYARYVARDAAGDLAAAGVTDGASFTPVYWSWQLTSAGSIVVLTVAGGLGGALLYGASRPKAEAPSATRGGASPTPV
ncbi:MAG: hypothetical protein ACTS8Z_00615 [Candidatus Limnocylindrales bacterium]